MVYVAYTLTLELHSYETTTEGACFSTHVVLCIRRARLLDRAEYAQVVHLEAPQVRYMEVYFGLCLSASGKDRTTWV